MSDFIKVFLRVQEMQLLLLKYREEIIAAKVAKEHGEETLKSEQVFLRSQLLSEQEEKQRMEEALSQEISMLQTKASNCLFCIYICDKCLIRRLVCPSQMSVNFRFIYTKSS